MSRMTGEKENWYLKPEQIIMLESAIKTSVIFNVNELQMVNKFLNNGYYDYHSRGILNNIRERWINHLKKVKRDQQRKELTRHIINNTKSW